MSGRAIALLTEVIEKHRWDADSGYPDGCMCGWNSDKETPYKGYAEHLAEALKPGMLEAIARSVAATAARMEQTPPLLKDQYIRVLQGIAGGLHEEANIIRAAQA